MTENEKDENSLTESQENVEQNDESLDDVKEISEEFKGEISQANEEVIQAETSDLNLLLEKEKKKSLRLLADYQNLEKQIIDRINARGDKIILDFLTVYEDFVRAKNVYEKDGGNVDSLNSIIKNMESILDHYEVKPIETEGKKLDPKLHEVVQEIEDNSNEDNSNEDGTIVKEIAKGYIIRGKVFKYSKVCVSKKLIKK